MSSVISTSSARNGASCLVRRLRASCCFRQGLELVKQDLHPFAHLYLGQQDTYGAVRVDEEVGAQSAGPPITAGPPALGVDTDAEAPAGTVPEAREEAVRRLGDSRHLVAGHHPEVPFRQDLPPLAPAAAGQHRGEAGVLADGRDELAVTDVERRGPGVEATGGRFELHQT